MRARQRGDVPVDATPPRVALAAILSEIMDGPDDLEDVKEFVWNVAKRRFGDLDPETVADKR